MCRQWSRFGSPISSSLTTLTLDPNPRQIQSHHFCDACGGRLMMIEGDV